MVECNNSADVTTQLVKEVIYGVRNGNFEIVRAGLIGKRPVNG
jgi:hypothetical protein